MQPTIKGQIGMAKIGRRKGPHGKSGIRRDNEGKGRRRVYANNFDGRDPWQNSYGRVRIWFWRNGVGYNYIVHAPLSVAMSRAFFIVH